MTLTLKQNIGYFLTSVHISKYTKNCVPGWNVFPLVTSNDSQGHNITLKSNVIYSILHHVAR